MHAVHMTTTRPRGANTATGPSKARTVYVIDIENLVGTGRPAASDVRNAAAFIRQALPSEASDLVIVGSGPGALWESYCGWHDARYLIQSGPDGADLALLRVLEEENIAGRFTSVVIASGDGIFAAAASNLASSGLAVTVVSRRKSLSRRLRMAANDVVYLPTHLFDSNHQDAA